MKPIEARVCPGCKYWKVRLDDWPTRHKYCNNSESEYYLNTVSKYDGCPYWEAYESKE